MTATPTHAPYKTSLLIELLTEELPPKALQRLSEAFAENVKQALSAHHLLSEASEMAVFATPRRLAVRLSDVLDVAPDQSFTEKLMPVKVGLDAHGQPTAALQKKLAAKGLQHLVVNDLEQIDDGKQMYLIAQGTAPGARLDDCLQGVVQDALANLPIPKVMRYQLADGITSVNFVRPAHALICLYGDRVIPIEALGLQSGRETQGHRFLHPGPIVIENAEQYETTLINEGHVVPSFTKRRDEIARALEQAAARLNATTGEDPAVAALLDEVTALVEAPAVYVGEFEPRFLAVPQECLILTMRLNQKYFPLFDQLTGKLTHQFLIVSNMPIENPAAIIEGNQRVVRPRLADAEFFYTTDCKQPLAQRTQALDHIVYHNKLGSQGARIERIRQVAAWIARKLNADQSHCERAALLAKADLTTLMVGEFPELQGIMGGYYARNDSEPESVAKAITTQYRIRWTEPVEPVDLPAVALFLAERAETLIGIWGIGLGPTGERDPFGLRRAALGMISAFEQLQSSGYLALAGEPVMLLEDLLQVAWQTFEESASLERDTVGAVSAFIRERYRNQLVSIYDRSAVEAVFSLSPALEQIVARIEATQAFMQSEAVQSLAAANKRIGNILKKSAATTVDLQASLLVEPAEASLAQQIQSIEPAVRDHMQHARFEHALAALAVLKRPVDQFFDDVMVMADDESVRRNRLALLSRLHGMMNQVADISRLTP